MHELQSISRREALRRMGAGALLACGLWPGALRADRRIPAGEFRFVVVNDTHAMTPACRPYHDGMVRQMRRENADFCLHAGDLTEKGTPEYLAGMRDAFRHHHLPLYPVMGNHDWTTPTSRRAYVDLFPLRLNYYFRHQGWQFIGLDTTDGQNYDRTSIRPATFSALDNYLPRLDRRKPTVLFTHFPLGLGMKYRPANADELLERFRPFNLQAVFCGHWHGYTEQHLGEVLITTNRCCALKRDNHDRTKAKGYFVCTARDGRVTRAFVEYKPAGAGE